MTKRVALDLASTESDGIAVLTVAGEVDLTNAEALQRAVGGTSAPAVVLDLSRVAYLDSSGIRAIDLSRRRLLADGRSLVIVSPPDTPSSWTFRVAGFGNGLVVESLEAALAVVRAHGAER